MSRSATFLLGVLLAVAVLPGLGGTPASAAGASAAPAAAAPGERVSTGRVVVLDGVRVRVPEGGRQVVTVNRTRGHRARVTLWARRGEGWQRLMRTTDGRIGYGGLAHPDRRRQGSGTTPLGTYRLRSAFGTRADRAAWRLPYRRIRAGDFWVQDNASPHYNRFRNQRRGGFRWWLPAGHPDASERLTDYGSQYEYAVVMDFNWGQVRRRGSGIFLHVNGRGATAGCVSAPRWFLQRLMGRLDPRRSPVISVGR